MIPIGAILPFFGKNWKVFAAVGVVAGIFMFGYNAGSNSVQNKWNEEQLRNAFAREQARKDNETVITRLEETKNANLVKIDAMRRDIAQLRVRLPETPCAGGLPKPPATTGGIATIATSGVIPATAQAAFDRFTVGVGEDSARADQVVEQCRVVM